MSVVIEHKAVLLNEVVEWMSPHPGGVYVDGTLGGGGHAKAILGRMALEGKYIGVDRDLQTLQRTEKELKEFSKIFHTVHGVFSEIPQLLKDKKIDGVDGVLLDLGVSSFQIDDEARGFSFLREGPLDMRMDPNNDEIMTAADVLASHSDEELQEIFQKFGEERFARRIAREIVATRRAHPFLKTSDLVAAIQRVVPPPFRAPRSKIHPATRVFQALRIYINGEIDHLSRFLENDFSFLKPKGRIIIISFHSLEDRLVKQTFRSHPHLRVLTKKPLSATEEELAQNPRSRSAKLRVAERK
ncbi:MAG: 16S rRNA (cytosine(1402)-N(4))-methyltransferase RsmH [Deltaproteobacteria bacterium]|nr:16S rRNA (cytosine(1402)-N(4))-methyltransferase RsmH [Deltaproteobacteria bacterium]